MEQWPRRDKSISLNFNDIEKIEEFKELHKLLKYFYFLPFELNMQDKEL
jgi:hypothetical protein